MVYNLKFKQKAKCLKPKACFGWQELSALGFLL